MKGRWAAGIVPRNFAWIVTERLAVSERPGGYAPHHRKVRRQEEILWLAGHKFTRIVSLLGSAHNLHSYEEHGIKASHFPFAAHTEPREVLEDLYPALLGWLRNGEKLLVHQEELGERLSGVIAGFLCWSGLLPEPPQAISIVEQLLRRQMGAIGREVVAASLELPPPLDEHGVALPPRPLATGFAILASPPPPSAGMLRAHKPASADADVVSLSALPRVKAPPAKTGEHALATGAESVAKKTARPAAVKTTDKAARKAAPKAAETSLAKKAPAKAREGVGERCEITDESDRRESEQIARSMNDLIEVRSLRVMGHHGALPGEQDKAQPFEIDLDVQTDFSSCLTSDDLADAVNYAHLVELARDVVTTRRFTLLESLAGAIATAVLHDDRIEVVTVTVRKLRPPIVGVGTVGVRLTASGGDVMTEVYLALGTNLGDRWRFIGDAVDALSVYDEALTVSPVYETTPVGGPPGQGRYLNCVVRLTLAGSPREVLALAQRLEANAQRKRSVVNGPRTLDVDVLLIEGYTSDDPELTVPHPRMHERAFVLAPLADLDEGLVAPDWRERLGATQVAGAIRKVGDLLVSPTP